MKHIFLLFLHSLVNEGSCYSWSTCPPLTHQWLLSYEHDSARIFMLCIHFLKYSFNTHNAGCQPNSQRGLYTYQQQQGQKRAPCVTPPEKDCQTGGLPRHRFRHATVAPPHLIGNRQNQNRYICWSSASITSQSAALRLFSLPSALFLFDV